MKQKCKSSSFSVITNSLLSLILSFVLCCSSTGIAVLAKENPSDATTPLTQTSKLGSISTNEKKPKTIKLGKLYSGTLKTHKGENGSWTDNAYYKLTLKKKTTFSVWKKGNCYINIANIRYGSSHFGSAIVWRTLKSKTNGICKMWRFYVTDPDPRYSKKSTNITLNPGTYYIQVEGLQSGGSGSFSFKLKK